MQLHGGAKLVRFYINVLEATVTVNLKVLYDTQIASTVRRHNRQVTEVAERRSRPCFSLEVGVYNHGILVLVIN